jgi:hypothetical protein
LVSALTSGFGAGALGSAFGVALVSVRSSGRGAVALCSIFDSAFGSDFGAGLEAIVPCSDFGSDFGMVRVVEPSVDLGVLVRGSALDRSSVRGAVSELGAIFEEDFSAVPASGEVLVLASPREVARFVDFGTVLLGSALELSASL